MKLRTTVVLSTLSIALLILSCGGSSDAPQAGGSDAKGVSGEGIFAEKCSMCHDFKENKIGPALQGVATRWNNDTTRLKSFIRNSQAFIKTGDPYANELYAKWNQSVMPSFEALSPEELDAVTAYLQ
ncbi:MAG: cytochrome c [Chitinophagaceae bacterium]